jgi:hypothetical protein
MDFILQLWYLLFAALSGWDNQRQQQIIAFQRRRLDALRKDIDPEVLKRLDLLADAE